MAVIPEPRGSDEPTSPGASIPRLRYTLKITPATPVKGHESEDSSALNSQRLPLPATPVKKQTSNKFLSKLFTRTTKEARLQAPNDDMDMDHPDLLNVITPASFIQPLVYKMEPRSEPRFRRFAGPQFALQSAPSPRTPFLVEEAKLSALIPDARSSVTPDDIPDAIPDAIPDDQSQLSISSEHHVARQREKAEQRLNGEEVELSVISELDPVLKQRYLGGVISHGAIIQREIDEEETNEGPMDDEPMPTWQERLQDEITKFVKEQHEYIAASSAADESTVPRWQYYIECYTKGNFNLINPPDPPPRSHGFTYLPALFPPCEAQRRLVYRSLNDVQYQWTPKQAKELMDEGTETFGTRFVSISFFDNERERFKAEKGYAESSISRTISIAAHALLSDDVFVVLDTKKDWRFEQNPLVINEKPKIRFFAGASMISHDGYPIGVFSVFDNQPRGSFPAEERRQLVVLAQRAMKSMLNDLENAPHLPPRSTKTSTRDLCSTPRSTKTSTRDLRSTPLLERDSVINGDYRPVGPQTPESSIRGKQYCPGAFNYPELKSSRTENSETFRDHHRSPAYNNSPAYHTSPAYHASPAYNEQTPPATASDDGYHFTNSSSGFGRNPKELSVDSGFNMFPYLQDMITPVSRDFEFPGPRPFSSSDITSLHMQPTNTPENSLIEEPIGDFPEEPEAKQDSDVTIEEFHALSYNDISEDPDFSMTDHDTSIIHSSPLIDLSTPRVNRRLQDESPSVRVRQNSAIPSSPLIDLATSYRVSEETASRSTETICLQSPVSFIAPSDSTWSGRSYEMKAKDEAGSACKAICEALGFDFVYTAEIYPKRSGSSERELTATGGLVQRLLASHGLKKPLELTSDAHLKAVRARGGIDYSLSKEDYASEDVYEGYIIPVSTEDGPVKYRTRGVLIGAFRKPRRGDRASSRLEKEAEVCKLRQDVEEMKSILLAGTRLELQRALDERVANPFPANEAQEVGKQSYGDARETSQYKRSVPRLSNERRRDGPQNDAYDVRHGSRIAH